ncbi:MAG: prephenate dehydrogenase [Lachnospiraceae bacterium]|jgi:prephenate dehydrogenase|nr:prephenate dehydrogenase [Lachnospiraceae bacterium]
MDNSGKLHIAFIGLGLIGGSIAKGFRRQNLPVQIYAYARHQETLQAALADGTVDEILDSAADERLALCDYIFLCTPVADAVLYMSRICPLMKPGCILTDVGSTKTEIHHAAETLGITDRFIGGHPMAGSEKSGYAYSTDHLVENAYYVLTPAGSVPPDQVERFARLIRMLGAIVLILDYERHDYVVAVISHLPHIIASSLVNLVRDSDDEQQTMKTVAAGGFKDITRIASSSPVMWQQICLTNARHIGTVLQDYIDSLNRTLRSVREQAGDPLYRLFDEAREYRDAIPEASMGPLKKDYAVYCDIVDESGAIATIATILATHQINIKNIGILHNREFEEGVLRVDFYDQESADQAAAWLTKFQYRLYKR